MRFQALDAAWDKLFFKQERLPVRIGIAVLAAEGAGAHADIIRQRQTRETVDPVIQQSRTHRNGRADHYCQ